MSGINGYWIGNRDALDVSDQAKLRDQNAINTAIQLIRQLESGRITQNDYEARMQALKNNTTNIKIESPETVIENFRIQTQEVEKIKQNLEQILSGLGVRGINCVLTYVINKINDSGYIETDLTTYIRQLAVDIIDENFHQNKLGDMTRYNITDELTRLRYIK